MSEPIEILRGVVHPWYCDTFGHMNVRWYSHFFDEEVSRSAKSPSSTETESMKSKQQQKNTLLPRRRGRVFDVCAIAGISKPTFYRIKKKDPRAPKTHVLPTGGQLEDLDAWREYLENLPTTQSDEEFSQCTKFQ